MEKHYLGEFFIQLVHKIFLPCDDHLYLHVVCNVGLLLMSVIFARVPHALSSLSKHYAISDSCSLRNWQKWHILPARTRGLGPVVWWGLWVICRTNGDPLGT